MDSEYNSSEKANCAQQAASLLKQLQHVCTPLTKTTDLIMAVIYDRKFIKFKVDLICIIYGNNQTLLCNYVACCPHIIRT